MVKLERRRAAQETSVSCAGLHNIHNFKALNIHSVCSKQTDICAWAWGGGAIFVFRKMDVYKGINVSLLYPRRQSLLLFINV
jgi:hypothetical protein